MESEALMIEINGVPIEDLTVEKLTDVKFEIEREIDKKEDFETSLGTRKVKGCKRFENERL